MNRKLILINPVDKTRPGYWMNRDTIYPPSVFGIIKSLTPANWDVEIIDENFEVFEYRKADLVGITAYTSSINRAYQIALQYKNECTPVVIGGIHVSVLPDEAIKYADAVVVGDAEGVWPDIIHDFENQSFKKKYNNPLNTLDNLIVPDHTIYNKGYWYTPIQTTRGCPMNCSFCAVHAVCKGRYLLRPADEVLYELETAPKNMICFVDDNFFGNTPKEQERTAEIFKGMIDRKMNKTWWSHVSLNAAQNEDFLDLAARSGCKMLFIGIESDDDASLMEVNKKINLKISPEKYIEAYRKIHKYGINILGSIIFGFDNDTIQALEKRTKFMMKSHIDILQILPLIPFPGTAVFEKFFSEDRLLYTNFPNDWIHYDGLEIAYLPKQIDKDELYSYMRKTYKKIYNKYAIYSRYLKTMLHLGSIKNAEWGILSNFNYRRIYFNDFIKPH